jgi:hypothetical protein
MTKIQTVGHRIWAIAEGYIPKSSTGPEPEMLSHETACLLNTGDQEAVVEIYVFFSNREPVAARRTKRGRLNDLSEPERIPLPTL